MIVVPSRMGRLNRRALFARLRGLGRTSRAELAKGLGMSQPTAGKIVDELIGLGLVEEVAEGEEGEAGGSVVTTPRMGRPARWLRVGRAPARFVVMQLGVTHTRLAVSPPGAPAEDAWQVEFETPGTAEAWGQALGEAARRLPPVDGWGVLVSVPGIVDERSGRVLFSPNLHWTESVNVGALVRRVWDYPVLLVQEERALALGHQVVEAVAEDFLLVDFGDGLGGAVVLGGRLYENPLPLSGELGHTPVLGNRRRCGCGASGCVETLVSTRGLLQSDAAVRRRSSVVWSELAARVVRDGVPAWLEEALDAASVAIAGALNVLGVRRVVLTGNLSDLGSAAVDYLRRAVTRGALWARFGEVECVEAPRRRAAGLVAAGIDRLVLLAPDRRRRETIELELRAD